MSYALLSTSQSIWSCSKSCMNGVYHKIKQYTVGGAVGGSIGILTNIALGKSTRMIGWIPEEPCFFWNGYYQEMKKQIPELSSEIDAWKFMAPTSILIGGIGEELLFRGVVQDLLLKRALSRVIQMVSPRAASWIDRTGGKVFRITLAAALFGGYHLIGTKGGAAIQYQAFVATAQGFLLGTIKESRWGLVGAIGSHMLINAIGIDDIYAQCIS